MKGIHKLYVLVISLTLCRSLEEDLFDCEVEDGNTYLECNHSAGHLITHNGSLIPHNTQCLQELDTYIVPVRCQHGAIVYPISEGTSESRLMRIKRRVDWNALAAAGPTMGAAVGLAVGAAFFGPLGSAVGGLIGATVGLAVQILCMFLCPGEPKEPPKIATHARLFGTGIPPVYAERGTREAVVRWTPTEYEGNINAKLISPYQSGNRFAEGSYLIMYKGEKDGLATVDYLQFEVNVHRCSNPGWPANGKLNCNIKDLIYGTVCTVVCNSGYVLESPNPSLTCDVSGMSSLWSQLKPTDCKPRACDPAPNISNGYIECPGNVPIYGSPCMVVCAFGYRVQGKRLMECNTEGKWGKVSTCLDVTPPQFKHGECPNDIQVYIDATNNTAKVAWKIPEGEDNSGDKPIIDETHGYFPGQRFEAGSHTVRYIIKDKDNNSGGSCVFTLQVLTLSCSPPKLNVTGGEHLNYVCPDAYILGAKCTLTCGSGYPKSGADIIQCLRKSGVHPPELDWTWKKGGLAPFCKETNCSMDALNQPSNGALACSAWTHGQMCQMQCQEGYDIPNIGDGMFVCGRSDGKWRPSANVPDCNVRNNVTHMNLPNEFYYYSEQCNNSAQNLLQIQENFVNALNTSNFKDKCVGVSECQAKFVDVICGPITSRRKRSNHGGNRVQRSAKSNAYILHFEFILPFVTEDEDTTHNVFSANAEMFSNMSDVIQEEVESGHFDLSLADLHVDNDSYGPGKPTMSCLVGTIPRTDTATCVGCPIGQFSDGGRCYDCPTGQYQNSTNSITCTSCPQGSNTTHMGASSIEQCLDYCSAGEYSPTGLSPCTKCASNSYQNESKSTTCQMCDKNTRSKTNGATSKSQCLAFDIEVRESAVAVLQNSEVMTVFMWVHLRNTTESSASFQLSNTDGEVMVILMFTPMIKVNVNGTEHVSNESVSPLTWTNVVITIHKLVGRLQVYVSGTSVFDGTTLKNISNYTSGAQEVITISGGITISGFNVVLRPPTVAEISTWSSTCMPDISNTIITMNDLANTENTSVMIPSMCDAVNDCDNSPCGNHSCIDKRGGFECHCLNGYSGRQCQTPPDVCKDNNCQNDATCIRESTNYTCECMYGFRGTFCETKAVDGQWSDWTMWSTCSQTCGGGNQSRTRQCDSPSADPEGEYCPGNNNETTSCNENVCPECSSLRRTYGLRIICEETIYIRRCSISCRQGLFFSEEPLEYYECGQVTGYKWTHQTEENPTGRLPSCTEIQPPQELAISFHSAYDTIPCTDDGISAAKEAMESKLSTVYCAQKGSCAATIHKPICNATRKKRDVGDALGMTIELISIVNASKESFQIESTMKNISEPSDELMHFVNLTLLLEMSAQDIFNSSDEFFQLTIDGKNHSMVAGSDVTFDKVIGCPSGTAPVNVFCSECPVGCYCDGKRSTMCPRGQFQDETSQSVCKMCPFGKTTDGVGSIYISECKVVIGSGERNDDTDNESRDINNGIKIAVGTSASIALLTLSIVGILLLRKHIKTRRMTVNASNTDVELSSQCTNDTRNEQKQLLKMK